MSHSNHSLHITKICIASVAIASFLGLKLKSIEYRKRRTKFAAWLLVTVSAIEISDFIVLLLLRGPTSTQNFVSTGLYTVSNLLQIDHLLFASDPAWHACLVSWFAMAIYNLLGIIDSTTGSSTLTTYLICGLVSASCQLFLNLTLFGAFLLDNGGRILLDNNVENTSTEPADDLSPKKVVEDIREAGGIWAWLKKFAIFKDWILPTNVRETILCCFVFTFILATVLLNLYAPYVVGGFIDKLAQMRRIRDSRYLSKTTAYVALVDAARIILPQVKRYLFFRFNNVRLARAKSRIFSFFMNHEASFFDRLDPTTATRSINLGLEVVTALDKLVLDLVPQVMQLTGALAAMISLYGFNPTLMVLFEAALSAIISLRKEKEMVKFHDDYRETSNQAERFRQNGLRGWKTVKQCGQEVREINKYTETVGKSRDQSQTISNINYSLYSLFMTLSIGCGWSSLYLVSESAVHGRVTVGSITTFFWYVGLVRGPLSYFEDVWGDLFHSFCEANQMRRLLEQKPKMKDGKDSIRNPHGNIRFVNVTFSYSKGDNDKTKVLQNFNMMVPARKMTALVGESGIGKTTMCDLGYRMHDLDGGTITIDDQDITTTKVEELRGSITYMPQEAHIFYDTIEGNIRYAKPDATSEEVRDAAKRAGLGDLEERGKGYAELVGAEGNQLSGGQKQRVALARALVRKPPIVMLDEPTSALDGETEAHVMRSIRENFRESTILLNAHRLSSVKEADHIIVLGKREDGFPEVVETGTHNELCALGGKYAKLWEKSIGKTIEMSVEDLL